MRYDVGKPADRAELRRIATGDAYGAHPLAKVLVAALDLLDHLARESLARVAEDDKRRRADDLMGRMTGGRFGGLW